MWKINTITLVGGKSSKIEYVFSQMESEGKY